VGRPLRLRVPALQAGLLTYGGLHAGAALRRWTGRYGEIAAGLPLFAVGCALAFAAR